jgi:hypothetical protein
VNLFKWSDASCIPKLLNRFMKERVVSAYVMGAAVLRGKIALENVLDYLRLMGSGSGSQ